MAAAGAPELKEGQEHLESTVEALRAFLPTGAAAGAPVDPMALLQALQLAQALAVVQGAQQHAQAPMSVPKTSPPAAVVKKRATRTKTSGVPKSSKSAPQVAPSPSGGSPATGPPSGGIGRKDKRVPHFLCVASSVRKHM